MIFDIKSIVLNTKSIILNTRFIVFRILGAGRPFQRRDGSEIASNLSQIHPWKSSCGGDLHLKYECCSSSGPTIRCVTPQKAKSPLRSAENKNKKQSLSEPPMTIELGRGCAPVHLPEYHIEMTAFSVLFSIEKAAISIENRVPP